MVGREPPLQSRSLPVQSSELKLSCSSARLCCLCRQKKQSQPTGTQFNKDLLSTYYVSGSLIKSELWCRLSVVPPNIDGTPPGY